jgi:thiamine-phosphate pyrophosphorylase
MPQSYYITDRHTSLRPILEQIQIAIEAGVDYVQIREKDLSPRELFDLAVSARTLAQRQDTRILINDRLDIALAAALDGIHLGQLSIVPEVVRAKVSGGDFLIGVSAHSLEELQRAHEQGVSFLTFGPVFLTPLKVLYGPPVGIVKLREACDFSKVPVFALGGINRQNYSECLEMGAAGIAGISLFQDERESVTKIVQEIRSFPSIV